MGKGRFANNSILGGTAKKVLRNSNTSTFINSYDFKKKNFKKILVPTDIFDIMSKDISYARELAYKYNAKIYLLNVVEVGDHKYPAEVIEKLRGDSYNYLSEKLLKEKDMNNVEPRVRVAHNAWIGIRDFIEEEKIDLVVMMSYGGKKIRSEFLGSVAEKVIEHSQCPVITLSH
ncbi:MAG: universal stress protein [Candidatus Dadabacteria bacterium]|nr:universal stress protein [Candidatus Dadabacteria bacterium]NIT13730.1 universal stress protein [Candidatus Dadabacteria bacterium]